jgi:hypothetical protein
LAERRSHPVAQLAFVIVIIALGLGVIETALRYENWPRPLLSGWRATESGGPLNAFGWRGQPPRRHQPGEFVVVMTGEGAVECLACPRDETLDVMLERALRRYNPDARVVTLGGTGYGQDQEFLALYEYFARARADLVVTWASIADDVPANTFRSGQKRPGQTVLKPSFALRGGDLLGPTEWLGQPIYSSKLSQLIRPWFIDIDRNWTILLPPADPGAASPPDAETQSQVDERLEQQRSAWSIWLTPRPARVNYGIELTRVLLTHMREVSTLRGARFTLLLTPAAADRQAAAPIALVHAGHWFLADPATRDAAIAEVTDGFDTVSLPSEDSNPTSPEAARRMMTRLAEALSQRDLLTPVIVSGIRH